MAEQDVIFAIQAINNAAGPVGQAASSLDRLGNTMNKTGQQAKKAKEESSRLESGLKGLGTAAAGAIAGFGLMGVANLTSELVQLGASVNSARGALNTLSGGTADRYVEAITEATRGTISQFDAMQISTKLLGMGIADTASEAAEFTRVAATLGGTFQGLGADQAASDFAAMIANMSYERVETFGFAQGQVRDAVKALQAEMPGLNSQLAFQQVIMQQGTAIANQLSGSLSSQSATVQRLKVIIEDTKAAFAQWLADGLVPIIDGAMGVRDAGQQMMAGMAREADSVDELTQRFMETEGPQRNFISRQTQAYYQAGLARGEFLTFSDTVRQLAEDQFRASRATEGATDVIERQVQTTREAAAANEELVMSEEEIAQARRESEQAARELEAALRDQLRTQQSLASVAGDVDGQIGNLGVTVLRTTGANAAMGEATAMLNDQIAQTSADLHEAQVAALAMGDDGTGPLGAKVQELSGYLGHLQNRLNDVRGAAGGVTTSMTVQALTQDELKQVGESYLDFLRATGNETLLAGDSFDTLRLKYGLATQEQIALEGGMQTLSDMMKNGTLTVEQAAAVYDKLITGQLGSADASEQEIERLVKKNGLIEKYGEDLIAQAEAAAQAYGVDPYASTADSSGALAENGAAAAEQMSAVADQTARINEAVSGVMTNAAPAFTALAESAPTALPPIMVLADRMSSMRNNLGVMGGLAESAFEAMNEAASGVVAEGVPLARANTLVAQMRAAWAYLLGNPTLSLNVYLSQIGSVQGASSGPTIAGAGGGVFMTSGPTRLTVGDNPGGVELVSVTPISGSGTTRVNGQAVHMAGGGTMLAGGMGTTNNVTFNVMANSFDDIVREARARGFAFTAVA